MRSAIRTNLTVYRAPPNLAARIGSALPREAPPDVRRVRQWMPQAAFGFGGVLAGAALALALVWTPPLGDPLASDVVAGHVRSMLADHLTDVATSDQHTVKPWLSARLDFSPVVEGLCRVRAIRWSADGWTTWPAMRAAAIVYRRDKHVINLFAFVSNETSDAPPKLEHRDGFNVIRWRMGGLTYVAVSDVEAAQLQGFVKLVQDASGQA